MTSSDARSIVTAFINQLHGLFAGLKHLPVVLEEIEAREKAVYEREQHLAAQQQDFTTATVSATAIANTPSTKKPLRKNP